MNALYSVVFGDGRRIVLFARDAWDAMQCAERVARTPAAYAFRTTERA